MVCAWFSNPLREEGLGMVGRHKEGQGMGKSSKMLPVGGGIHIPRSHMEIVSSQTQAVFLKWKDPFP